MEVNYYQSIRISSCSNEIHYKYPWEHKCFGVVELLDISPLITNKYFESQYVVVCIQLYSSDQSVLWGQMKQSGALWIYVSGILT